jgi:hypothetical protein
MTILKLDQESWQRITQTLPFVDLYHLLMTCPAVYQILRNGGGISSVNFGPDTRMKRPPPTISKFQHLRELEISSGFTIPKFSPGHIIFLPKTLRKLKLAFPNVYECFYRGFNCWTPAPTVENVYYDPSISSQGVLIDMNEFLPDLQVLVLYGSERTQVESNPHKIIPNLPRSLTHLELQRPVSRFLESLYTPTSCTSALPPNLVVLKLPRCSGFSDPLAISNLSSLERLSLHVCTTLPRLPTSLLKLKCTVLPTSYQLDAETAPNLTSLTFLGTVSGLATLPPKLAELSVPNSTLFCRPDSTIFPKTLTRLDLQSLSVVSVHFMERSASALSEWKNLKLPPGLKQFNIRGRLQVPTPHAAEFFRSLPSIELASFGLNQLTIDNLWMLPKTLTSITEAIDFSPTRSCRDREGVESTITDLASLFPDLTKCSLFSSDKTPNKVIFPKHLTSLVLDVRGTPAVSTIGFLDNQQGCWPAYLRRMTYSSYSYPSDQALIALPNSLYELTLYASFHSFNPSFSMQQHEMTSAGLSKLPNCLTSLEISTSIHSVEPDWLHHLPRALRTLRLDHYDGMQDEHVQSLPRTLTDLNMRNSTKLSDQCLRHLPNSLRDLKLRRNRLITSALFTHIPHGLIFIDLRKNCNFLRFHRIPPHIAFKAKKVSQNF